MTPKPKDTITAAPMARAMPACPMRGADVPSAESRSTSGAEEVVVPEVVAMVDVFVRLVTIEPEVSVELVLVMELRVLVTVVMELWVMLVCVPLEVVVVA